MDALGVETASFSGESMGAGIAAHLALAHPERLKKLVLITGIAPIYRREFADTLYNRTMEALSKFDRPTMRRRLEWLVCDPRNITEELISLRFAMYSQPHTTAVMDRILQRIVDEEVSRRNHITAEQWRRTEHETLVLWTSEDPGTPVAEAEQVSTWLPRGSFAVMNGCAHWPRWEVPETFNRLHLGFLLDGPSAGRKDPA